MALEDFAADHRPHSDFAIHDINEIHVDAGSSLMSTKFTNWCIDYGIALKSAAPAHQEMNGMAERIWQTCRVMAFKMLSAARLGLAFFHWALIYAQQICAVLPAKSTSRVDEEGELVPTTPYFLYFNGQIPDVRRFRVWGCPAVVKVYRQTDSQERVLDHKNIVQ